jgi:V8-like Glu-specific endopeptidase
MVMNVETIDWSNFNSTLLIEVTRPEGTFTCTGVAIKNDVVLTAAHCLEGSILKIRVFNQPTYNPNAKAWTVQNFEIHPDYNKENSNFKSDIARIKLNEELPADTVIYPILKKKNDLHGKILRLGYGARSQSNIRTLITPEFKSLRNQESVLELNDMYSFSGDSGGPIFIQRDGQMYLVAIHSTLSHGPEGKFSFNPLLSTQREWINASWN